MARTVEDVLARRTRALFLNARAAAAMAPRVAALLTKELEHDTSWRDRQVSDFQDLARGYIVASRDNAPYAAVKVPVINRWEI